MASSWGVRRQGLNSKAPKSCQPKGDTQNVPQAWEPQVADSLQADEYAQLNNFDEDYYY